MNNKTSLIVIGILSVITLSIFVYQKYADNDTSNLDTDWATQESLVDSKYTGDSEQIDTLETEMLPDQAKEVSIDGLQVLPTPSPQAIITFDGNKPAVNQNSINVGDIIHLDNKTEKAIKVVFSSGTSMDVGSMGNAESIVLKSGIETINISDGSNSYTISIAINSNLE